MRMHHFILIYDAKRAQLLECREFGRNVKRALKVYFELELEHWGRDDLEIVLLGSDSLDTLKVTHSRYFEDPEPVPF